MHPLFRRAGGETNGPLQQLRKGFCKGLDYIPSSSRYLDDSAKEALKTYLEYSEELRDESEKGEVSVVLDGRGKI
jgi:hypothetical protein